MPVLFCTTGAQPRAASLLLPEQVVGPRQRVNDAGAVRGQA